MSSESPSKPDLSGVGDVRTLLGRDPGSLSREQLESILAAEMSGSVLAGELPIRDQRLRESSLDSPAFFVTEVVDAFYKRVFERRHYELLDEVMRPYLLGEEVRIGGASFDPRQHLGLLVLLPRTLYKSSIARLVALWVSVYRKLREGVDARVMYVHQVIGKAVEAGEVIRAQARHNERFRRAFPEFRAPVGEWDTKEKWRWPNFETRSAAEASFTFYGESSDKTGGHYTDRFLDDWETERSVTTPETLEKSWRAFEMMSNLADLAQDFNPYVICGTTYHWQGTHKRLERDGGYIVYRAPAHEGSAKALFDLAALNPREESGRRKIESGLKKLEEERSGDLNFPKLYTWRVLYDRARGGRSSYGGQQLLDPTPEGDRRFDHDAVDEMWCRPDELPQPGGMWLYVRCDPAIGRKRTNDDCAVVVGGVDWRGWRYVVDGWCGRERRPSEIVRRIYALARRWQGYGYKVVNIGVESVGYQEALAQTCRDGVPAQEASYHGESIPVLKAPCPVRSIRRSADMRKFERILEMEGPITRREVRVSTKCPVGRKLMDQLKNFPHDRDDLLDAMHDLWESVMLPPRDRQVEVQSLDGQFLRLLGRKDDEGGLKDTHGTSRLLSWGG